MKVFIWQYVDNATDNWHSEGGILVVARDLDNARFFLRGGDEGKARVPETCEAFTEEPTVTLDAGDEPSGLVLVFPDAGCC